MTFRCSLIIFGLTCLLAIAEAGLYKKTLLAQQTASKTSPNDPPDFESRDIDIVLAWVRLEDSGIVAEYSKLPAADLKKQEEAIERQAKGLAIEAQMRQSYRLEIPLDTVDIRVATGKRVSIDQWKAWGYSERPVPVILAKEPDRLVRDFQEHLALDSFIVRLPKGIDLWAHEVTDTDQFLPSNQPSSEDTIAFVTLGDLADVRSKIYLETRTKAYKALVPLTQLINDGSTITEYGSEVRTQEQIVLVLSIPRIAAIWLPSQQTRTETNQVLVPYTEMVEQSYTVNVPYTEMVEQSYTVNVPYTETITVPVTTQREVAVMEKYVDRDGTTRERPVYEEYLDDSGNKKKRKKTEIVTEQVMQTQNVSKMRQATMTRTVPVTKTLQEVRTRTVSVARQRMETQTREVTYTVMVRESSLRRMALPFADESRAWQRLRQKMDADGSNSKINGPVAFVVFPDETLEIRDFTAGRVYDGSTLTGRLLAEDVFFVEGRHPGNLDQIENAIKKALDEDYELESGYKTATGLLLKVKDDQTWLQVTGNTIEKLTQSGWNEVDGQVLRPESSNRQFRFLQSGTKLEEKQNGEWRAFSDLYRIDMLDEFVSKLKLPQEQSAEQEP